MATRRRRERAPAPEYRCVCGRELQRYWPHCPHCGHWISEEEDAQSNEWDDDDEDDTIPCPHCKEPIHEDTQRCPHCENWISEEDAPPERKPTWFLITVLVCLLIVVLWIFGS